MRCLTFWEVTSSRCSISQVLMCLSYLQEIQEARYCSVGISLFLRSSSVFLKVWYWTSSISITLDLLEWQFWVPTPSLLNQKLQGWSPSICVYKPLRQLGSTLKFENHCTRPIQLSPQRELRNNSLKMGGTQVPTYLLTAGANIRQSLVGLRPEEWVGRDRCRG